MENTDLAQIADTLNFWVNVRIWLAIAFVITVLGFIVYSVIDNRRIKRLHEKRKKEEQDSSN